MADSVLRNSPTRSPRALISQTTITHLPDPIVADILSRLPTKTIFISRFVCKLWNYLTTTSYFSKLHFSRSHLEFLLQVKHPMYSGVANWIDPQFDMTQGLGTHVFLKPRTETPYNDLGINSSCRGLIFSLNQGKLFDSGVVCNPLTGEYLTLPKCEKGEKSEHNEMVDPVYREFLMRMDLVMGRGDAICCFNAYAFGYCSSTKHFKVLRIFSNVMNSSWMDSGSAEINVVGSDSWRGIGSAPFCPSATSKPILLDEVAHWLCDDNEVVKFIVYFDFGSESFGGFEPPFGIANNYQERKYRMTLSVFEGCLVVCDVLQTGKFDIWVMKKYGAQESWSKDFVVDTTVVNVFMQGRHQPLKVLSNGEILMLSLGDGQEYPKFVCYNPESNAVRMLMLFKFARFEVVAHTPSFVPLKDVIMGDDLNVLNFKDVVPDDHQGCRIGFPSLLHVGTWRTSPAPFLMEHCCATVDATQSFPTEGLTWFYD